MRNYTLVSQNDIEILRFSKPDSSYLSLALLQKYIFDIVLGVYVATAALNLYAVFDFLTFQETLEDMTDSAKLSDHSFKFAL